MKIQIGLFYQYISSYKFKSVFRCKQISYKNFKTVNLKPENSKKKKTFFGNLKIRHSILVYSKNFFSSFSKLGVGGGGQPNNFFFRPKACSLLGS